MIRIIRCTESVYIFLNNWNGYYPLVRNINSIQATLVLIERLIWKAYISKRIIFTLITSISINLIHLSKMIINGTKCWHTTPTNLFKILINFPIYFFIHWYRNISPRLITNKKIYFSFSLEIWSFGFCLLKQKPNIERTFRTSFYEFVHWQDNKNICFVDPILCNYLGLAKTSQDYKIHEKDLLNFGKNNNTRNSLHFRSNKLSICVNYIRSSYKLGKIILFLSL